MRALLFAALLAISCCSCAMASVFDSFDDSPYSAVVVGTQVGTQTNNWTYTIVNTSTDINYTVWCLQVEVDMDTLISSVTTPSGWSANWKIPHVIQWTAVSGNLAADNLRSGFGVLFNLEPAYQNWTANFDNTIDQDDAPVCFGVVSTPEPGSILALLVGLIGIAGINKRSN